MQCFQFSSIAPSITLLPHHEADLCLVNGAEDSADPQQWSSECVSSNRHQLKIKDPQSHCFPAKSAISEDRFPNPQFKTSRWQQIEIPKYLQGLSVSLSQILSTTVSPNLNIHALWSQGMEIDELVQCVVVPNTRLQLFITFLLLYYSVAIRIGPSLYVAVEECVSQTSQALHTWPVPPRRRAPHRRSDPQRSERGQRHQRRWSHRGLRRMRRRVLHHFNVQKHGLRATEMVIFTKKMMKNLNIFKISHIKSLIHLKGCNQLHLIGSGGRTPGGAVTLGLKWMACAVIVV